MKSIIVRSAIVLGLGIAPGAVLAQTEEPLKKPPVQQQTEGAQSGATTGAATEGQTGAEVKPPEGKADATAGNETESQTGTTMKKPPEGQAGTETKTEGQAGATTDKPAEGQSGAAQTEEPTDGQAKTEGTAQTEQPADGQDETETGAIAPVEVTVEQRTEIKQVIQEVEVEPVDVDSVDFDISVGVAVPQTIEVHTLPPRIVEIVPAYEGYRYFLLADGRIVIVEPDTLEIVVILV